MRKTWLLMVVGWFSREVRLLGISLWDILWSDWTDGAIQFILKRPDTLMLGQLQRGELGLRCIARLSLLRSLNELLLRAGTGILWGDRTLVPGILCLRRMRW